MILFSDPTFLMACLYILLYNFLWIVALCWLITAIKDVTSQHEIIPITFSYGKNYSQWNYFWQSIGDSNWNFHQKSKSATNCQKFLSLQLQRWHESGMRKYISAKKYCHVCTPGKQPRYLSTSPLKIRIVCRQLSSPKNLKYSIVGSIEPAALLHFKNYCKVSFHFKFPFFLNSILTWLSDCWWRCVTYALFPLFIKFLAFPTLSS